MRKRVIPLNSKLCHSRDLKWNKKDKYGHVGSCASVTNRSISPRENENERIIGTGSKRELMSATGKFISADRAAQLGCYNWRLAARWNTTPLCLVHAKQREDCSVLLGFVRPQLRAGNGRDASRSSVFVFVCFFPCFSTFFLSFFFWFFRGRDRGDVSF